MNSKYAKAYTEVLEIISHLPDEEYSKIPKEKIEFYEKNKDSEYVFKIDPQIDLEKQNISEEANAVLVTIYRDYFATDRQKEILKGLLEKNEIKKEEEKRKKYNPDDIFKTETKPIQETKIEEQKTDLVVKNEKENFIIKFLNYLKSLFRR